MQNYFFSLADAEVPLNPIVALEQNAMKITRSEAVKQVKKMMTLINDITSTAIKNSVNGEQFTTKTEGVQIFMSK